MKSILYGDPDADICLVQMVDDHDMEYLQNEYDLIVGHYSAKKPLLVAVHVDDWNKDLSPWEAPAAFGKESFGGGAENTLKYLTEELLPKISEEHFKDKKGVEYIIGGYSLAGLFALWASYRTDMFSGCAAVSPSVWFPGWMKYAEGHEIKADNIYLSLGRKEPETRNSVMKTVGDCIIKQNGFLADKNHILEWNEGNHFKEPDVRTAKGFIWALKQLDDCCKNKVSEIHTRRNRKI